MLKNQSTFKIAIQVILFGALGLLILYLMWQSLGSSYEEECALNGIPSDECSLLDKLVDDYRSAKVSWLVVISVCFFLSQLFRAIRWVILLKPMGYNISHANSLATTLVGYFANLGAPRIGEFVRAGLICKYEKIPVEKAFATIVIERIIDVMMLAILLALGFIFHFENLWGYISKNLSISYSYIGYFLLFVVIVAVGGIYLLRLILRLEDERLGKISLKLKKMLQGFIEGFKEVRNIPNKGAFWTYSFGIWIMYFLMHYLAFFSYEPTSHLSMIDAILVFDFGSLGVAFPSQGGMGSYHFMIMESLKIFGIPPIEGMSFAMITFFTLTVFCTILLGLISLILLPFINRTQ